MSKNYNKEDYTMKIPDFRQKIAVEPQPDGWEYIYPHPPHVFKIYQESTGKISGNPYIISAIADCCGGIFVNGFFKLMVHGRYCTQKSGK